MDGYNTYKSVPSLSSIPNDQMDGEAMMKRQPLRGEKGFVCPAVIHNTPEKGSDWPGLSQAPITVPGEVL